MNSVLVYVSEVTARELDRRLSMEARSGWTEAIHIKSPNTFEGAPGGAGVPTHQSSTLELEISREWQRGDISRVYVEQSLKLRLTSLKEEGVKVRCCARATILRELLDEIRRRRLHWLAHSVYQWEKAGIQHVHPQAWRDQFASLGLSWVGEGLLKQLHVISDAELLEGLVVPKADLLGIAVAHGCAVDQEPGSSANSVKHLLEHTYTEKLLEINFNQQPPDLEEIDHLYIYEDGLWSGVELVGRLAQLAEWPLVKTKAVRVSFRFAATSEAGLLAARHFLQRERLTSVDVAVGRTVHLAHLKADLVAKTKPDKHASDEEMRRSIDGWIDPMAFRDTDTWMGKSREAMSACSEIGKQLVKPWIMRTKGNENLDHRVMNWALGAFNFASVTAFSMSVPKPVLPLLWLSGPVEISGRRVEWRPLFWDSRRTGYQPPLRDRPR